MERKPPKNDVSRDLAGVVRLKEDLGLHERPQCQEKGCTAAGNVDCVLDGIDLDTNVPKPDTHYYFCSDHAIDNGFCGCCGTFIAGIGPYPGAEYCDNCKAQIDDDDFLDPEYPRLDIPPDTDL